MGKGVTGNGFEVETGLEGEGETERDLSPEDAVSRRSRVLNSVAT
jgi:hypothetical protein